jgi:hypothetical protein
LGWPAKHTAVPAEAINGSDTDPLEHLSEKAAVAAATQALQLHVLHARRGPGARWSLVAVLHPAACEDAMLRSGFFDAGANMVRVRAWSDDPHLSTNAILVRVGQLKLMQIPKKAMA